MLKATKTRMTNVAVTVDWVLRSITISDIDGQLTVTLPLNSIETQALETFVEMASAQSLSI